MAGIEMKSLPILQPLPSGLRADADGHEIAKWSRDILSALERLRVDLVTALQSTQKRVLEVEEDMPVIPVLFGTLPARPATSEYPVMFCETEEPFRTWVWSGDEWGLVTARLVWTDQQ